MSLPPTTPTLNVFISCLPVAPYRTQLTEQIQAYGQVCRAAALEEAAQICNGEQWRNEKKEVAYLKAFNEGCADCEAAIRRLK